MGDCPSCLGCFHLNRTSVSETSDFWGESGASGTEANKTLKFKVQNHILKLISNAIYNLVNSFYMHNHLS